MPKKRNRGNVDPLVKEVEAIKLLLILLLIKAGAKQGEIAAALQIDQAQMSRMLPSRKLKKFEFIDSV